MIELIQWTVSRANKIGFPHLLQFLSARPHLLQFLWFSFLNAHTYSNFYPQACIHRGYQLFGCQSVLRIRESDFFNMTTLRRQTRSFWHSISCNYLMIPLLSLLIAQCKPQNPDPTISSYSNKTYTYGDQFNSNLDNVLNVLFQNTPTTGLNVSSYGEFPNRVYGLLQCRGDASQKECSDCCQNLRNYVSTFCRNSIECRCWLLMCELHYRNYSSSRFISNSSTETPGLGLVVDQSLKGEETAFRNLVYNLSIKASTSINRFATGPSVDSSGHKIYALVQCDRVLSTANCSNCLSDAIKLGDTYPYGYSAVHMDGCFVLQSKQSLSTNHSEKIPMNFGVGRAVLLLIALLLQLM